jgi:hypothetical protein
MVTTKYPLCVKYDLEKQERTENVLTKLEADISNLEYALEWGAAKPKKKVNK